MEIEAASWRRKITGFEVWCKAYVCMTHAYSLVLVYQKLGALISSERNYD